MNIWCCLLWVSSEEEHYCNGKGWRMKQSCSPYGCQETKRRKHEQARDNKPWRSCFLWPTCFGCISSPHKSWTSHNSSSAGVLVCKQEPVKGILYLIDGNIQKASRFSERRCTSKIIFLHVCQLRNSRSRCQQNTPVLARIDSWFTGSHLLSVYPHGEK